MPVSLSRRGPDHKHTFSIMATTTVRLIIQGASSSVGDYLDAGDVGHFNME